MNEEEILWTKKSKIEDLDNNRSILQQLSVFIFTPKCLPLETPVSTFFLTTDDLFQESLNYFLGKKVAGVVGEVTGRSDKLQSSL